ncbi:MAG TPA: hypothetical protein VNZ54_00465, partial [bacterium]|nr:hypothetical protein [bacterium]
MVAIFALGLAFQADAAALTVSQSIPSAYQGDGTGQSYQAVVNNGTGLSLSVTSLSLSIPATGFSLVTASVATLPLTATSVTGSAPNYTVTFPGPALLLAGQSLTVNYRLATLCTAPAGQQALVATAAYTQGVTATANANGAVTVLAGAVAVGLSNIAPVPFNAQVGQAITVRSILTNTGNGTVFNTPFSTAWQAGLGNPVILGGTVSPLPSLVGSAATTTSVSLAAGASAYFDTQLTILSCGNTGISSTATAACNAANVGIATLSPTLILKEPDVLINAPAISLPYCSAAAVTITVSNTGQGSAYGFQLGTDLAGKPLVVSNLGANWAYSAGVFTYTGATVTPGAVLPLTFTLAATSACNGANGSFVITPAYTDACGGAFAPPQTLCTYASGGGPALAVSSSLQTQGGDPTRAFLGEAVTVTAGVTLTQPGSISGNVSVTETLPGAFLYTGSSASLGGVAVAGNVLTWTLSPAQAAASPTLTIYTQLTTTACLAGIPYTAALAGSAGTVCGCALADNASSTLFLQSQPLNVYTQSKSITNLPGSGSYDLCGTTPVAYAVSLAFGSGSGTWTGSTLTDTLAGGQTYVPGTMQYNPNGGGWTNVPVTVTTGAAMTLDLDFLAGVLGNAVANQSVQFRYNLALGSAGLAACSPAGTLDSVTAISVSNSAAGCVVSGSAGTLYLEQQVPVQRASMSLGLALSSNTIYQGEMVTATASLGYRSNPLASGVSLTVSTLGYQYLGGPSYTGFGGAVPAVVLGANSVTFTFAGPVAAAGTIQFVAVKDCSSNWTMNAGLGWQDACGASCSALAAATPQLEQSGSLEFVNTPSSLEVDSASASWTLYVTNKGDGDAPQTLVTHTF